MCRKSSTGSWSRISRALEISQSYLEIEMTQRDADKKTVNINFFFEEEKCILLSFSEFGAIRRLILR